MHVCVCMCIAQVCTVMCTVVCAVCPASFGIHAPFLTTYLPSQSSSFSFGNIHECSISAYCLFCYHHPLPLSTHLSPLTYLPSISSHYLMAHILLYTFLLTPSPLSPLSSHHPLTSSLTHPLLPTCAFYK